MFDPKIPKAKQANVMSCFWSMLKELESKADGDKDALLKHQVAAYFKVWNDICDDTAVPVWVTRAERIAKGE